MVAVPGWSAPYSLAALTWCADKRIPAIVMSESTQHDEPRKWWKECVKKQVVKNFSAGLVGGSAHIKYVKVLGLADDAVFTGYDVVDNDYFARGAEMAQSDYENVRNKHHLPENYFLSSNRFVEKKNLPRLIRAYSLYHQQAGPDCWKLVIIGDGGLRPDLEELISEFRLTGEVLLPGFLQYPDLPVYYGLANAYVHASTTEQWGLVVNEAMASGLPVIVSERCGCAPDLVEEGRNGYTFDPYDVKRLAELMQKISGDEIDLVKMGQASRDMISEYSPDVFAEGVLKAARKAMAQPAQTNGYLTRSLLKFMAGR